VRLLPLAALLVASSALADEAPVPPAPGPAPSAVRLLIERFQLFPSEPGKDPLSTLTGRAERLFHLVGDPDALVTLGDLGGNDTLRVKAAVEMNDVVLHAIAPDERMKGDTRQRAAGDYRALDSAGRPYQLRLGARLVW
jgi:hypothetical protein